MKVPHVYCSSVRPNLGVIVNVSKAMMNPWSYNRHHNYGILLVMRRHESK